MLEISKRLQAIADFIPNGARVADIGSDHAYLPTYLVKTGKSMFVIAGEVNEGPFQSARNQIQNEQLEHFVQVRKGNGLEVIRPNEVDTIVIAGMGGSLIVEILSQGLNQLTDVQRLILQPNVGEEIVRKFALEHGWELVDEFILEEDERIYEILSFVRGNATRPYENSNIPLQYLLKIGPFHLKSKPDLLLKKWNRELMQMERIIEQLKRSDTPASVEKRNQLVVEYRMIKEILQ